MSELKLPGGYYFKPEPEEFIMLNGEPVFTLRDKYGKRAEYIPQQVVAAMTRPAPERHNEALQGKSLVWILKARDAIIRADITPETNEALTCLNEALAEQAAPVKEGEK